MTEEGNKKKRQIYALFDTLVANGREEPLSQKELEDKLKEEGINIHRNTVGKDLHLLKKVYPNNIRYIKEGTSKRWYFIPPLEPGETHYLADSVISAKRMTQKNKKELIDKIIELSGNTESFWNDILIAPEKEQRSPRGYSFAEAIETLTECIRKKCQVSFNFGEVNKDGILEEVKPGKTEGTEIGGIRLAHTVSPYYLVASGGGYYLLAMYPGKNKLFHFRVDFMFHVTQSQEDGGEPLRVTPLKKIEGFEDFNLKRYLAEHPYMQYDPPIEEPVTIAINNTPQSRHHFFQHFGECNPKRASKSKGNRPVYRLTTSKNAAVIYAFQFADEVEILEPKQLREEVLHAAKKMAAKYSKNTGSPSCDEPSEEQS